jgi:3-hydroxyacyl-CoA dehydrogenase/enoyl-CoA hydratase/3-hydroxybutyryl-CoA epimerase
MALFQAQTMRIDQQPDGVAVLWLDVPGRSMNIFNRQVFADLDAALDRVATEAVVRALVIRSAKPSGFFAGADVKEFTTVQSADDARALSEKGQRLFDKVAALRVPTIAVLHGHCLGGGLEFALACDYRLVVEQPGTQLGLPEILLGLIPGWGGTQRLPRVVGLERALDVILGGRRPNAAQALRWRLADALSPGQQLLPAELQRLVLRAVAQGKRPKKGLPLLTWRQRLLESNALGRRVIFGGAERVMLRRRADDMPAPREAWEAVRVGLAQGMEAGLAYERDAISRLAMTPACHNLIRIFLAWGKVPKSPDDTRRPGADKVQRVGIVGAGTMGAGIAQLAAIHGCEVVVQEVNEDALGAGLLKIAALFQKAVERRVLSQAEADRKLAAVKGTVRWEGFAGVDVVVEAVVENLEAKRAIFRELEKHTRADTVLATNTSSLPVASLQEGMQHPRRVAGLHFFNPVHKLPLVEVARTPATNERTVNTLLHWAVALGKTPVLVQDSPGFVVNRVLMPYLNEAVLLVAEGMAVKEVDQVMGRFGMPMGPLELLDQVGLDVAAHIAASLQPAFGARFPPNPAFEQMRQMGWLGHKSGFGFYRYKGRSQKVNEAAVELLQQNLSAQGVDPQQARDRMVLLMVNEAAACLGEQLTDGADTIDLAMILGTSWAPHRGGPLHYGADRGYPAVVQTLTELAGRLGPRFEPCAELQRLARAGVTT